MEDSELEFSSALLQSYLDSCCLKFQSILTLSVTFLSHLTCCLLTAKGFDIDVVTIEIHPIYVVNVGGEEQYEEKKVLVAADYNYDDSGDRDFSNYSFPSPIWNRLESWEVGVKSAAVAPVALIAILGNLAVIRILIKARLTRNPINLFILNMSIADLLMALIFPWVILFYHFYQNFMLGEFICRTEGFVLTTLMLASVLSLTAISYDRLTAVVFPFKRRMERRTAKIVIWAVWLVSMACASPLIVWRTYHERQWLDFDEKWCKEDLRMLKLYWLIIVILLVWVPLSILVISYTAIVVKLDTLEKRQRDHPAQVKMKSKVVRMLFLIVILFTLCWCPFSAFIITRNNLDSLELVPSWLSPFYFVAHYLTFVNCAINPIIYGLKNDNLKREMRLALPKFMRTNRTCEISAVHQAQRAWRPGNHQPVGILKGQFERSSKNILSFGKMTGGSNSFDDNGPANVVSFERKNSALEDIGINVSANLTKLTFTD